MSAWQERNRSGAERWLHKTSALQNCLILLMAKFLRRDKRGMKGQFLTLSRRTLATAAPQECEEMPDQKGLVN